MPIDSILNFASENLTYLFQKCGVVLEKAVRSENLVKDFLKRHLAPAATELGRDTTKFLAYATAQD